MKKLLLASLCLALFGCSDNDSDSTTPTASFHPPTWVHGTWIISTGGQEMGLKFTSDNVCTISNTTANCFKETIALYEGTQVVSTVTEEISDNEYNATINISGNISNYRVQKVSTTEIKWVLNSTTSTILTKQ